MMFWTQIITFVLGLIGGGFGLVQYYDSQSKEREEAVQAIYVAFLQYTNPSFRAIANLSGQWEGWVIYMGRFAVRPAFRTVWAEVKDEFDSSFVACMSAVTREVETRQESVTAQSLEALGTQVKDACRL